MSFDWMKTETKNRSNGPKEQTIASIKEQAGLLRRLGYDAKYATKRCLANVHWQYDGQKAPLKDLEIKKVVAQIYG